MEAGAAIAGVIAVIAGISLPWITAGLGSEAIAYSGLQLPVAAIPVAVAALAAAILSAACLCGFSTLAPFAVAAGGIGALLAAATIAMTETAAFLIPSSLLPDTVRRTTFVLSAGPGIWLALVGSSLTAVAMLGRIPSPIVRRVQFPAGEWKRATALLALAALTALIAWLRYKTWIDASALKWSLSLPASAAPWVGPLSLVAVWMMVSAVALAFYRAQIAGLVAAAAGWLTSILAALVVLAVGSVGSIGIEDLAPPAAAGYAPGFHVTGFVWIAFLTGLAAAGVGALLVHLADRPEGGGSPWRS